MNALDLDGELRAVPLVLVAVAIGGRYLQGKPGRCYLPASELEHAARQVVAGDVRIEREDDGSFILDFGRHG